jgi:hypothetical protein
MNLKTIIQKMPRLLLATSYPHQQHCRELLKTFYISMTMCGTDPFLTNLKSK